ncbi:hypothetical protein ACOSQ3_021529 [Xanthoceras sorbifolium]
MSKFLSSLKFNVEKFDGKINFVLWQVQVKDVLIQSGLHKVLKEKSGFILKDSSKDESSKGDSSKGDNWKKDNSKKKIICWACGQSGHVKKIVKMVKQVRQVAPTLKVIMCLVKTLNLSFEKDMYILIAYH